MKFLSAQLDNDYNIWQLQVQMFNFRKFGIEDKAIVLIGYNPTIGVTRKALEFKNQTKALVIYLPDNRDLSNRFYTPSIRPHLVKQLYKTHSNLLENRAVLFHDCDMLFTKLPHVKDLILKRKIYVSDISRYVPTQLDTALLKDMCRIVGIPSSMVMRNEKGMGGVQYLFNSSINFSYDFWEKIENDSNNIYKFLLVSGEKYVNHTLVQAWSADMWSIIWNIWLLGVDTELSNELSFTIATSPIVELDKNNIYHNMGVDNTNEQFLLNKRKFINSSPFNSDLSYVDKQYCSSFYVREIRECKEYYKGRE